MTDDLEATLRTLSTRLDVPPPPDVTDAVLARLDEPPARAGWRPVQRLVAAAVAALVALATAMVISPAVRAAVFDFLRIGGVEIQNQPAPVTPSVDPPQPGERDVTLAEARTEAAFPLKVPSGLGEPATVRLIDGTPPRVVSMIYGTDLGTVHIDQFDGGLDPMFTKFASAGDIHRTDVNGAPAIWGDRPHVVIFDDRDGNLQEATARMAGSTLIWETDGITYRVEGELTEAQAVKIAESLR